MNSLDGIRILDLSRVLAGPWCTQTLADLGADVIKVEKPGLGDDTRGWGPPFLTDAQGKDTTDAAYYLSTNRNKRSITCDIAKPQGQALMRELVAHCDVFIENFKVGDMARYGLDAPSLLAINPRLVYCSVTGFGQTGPYSDRAGYDYAVQGMGGLMSVTGEPDGTPGGGPQRAGVALADILSGMYASVAILAALRHRDTGGKGQQIDIGMLDVQVATLANQAMNYLTTDQAPSRLGKGHMNIVPYGAFPASDGHLILAVGNDAQFRKMAQAMGRPDIADDPRFATIPLRVAHRDLLVPLLETITATRTIDAWVSAMEAVGVPCGPINTIDRVFADPQVRARGMRLALPHQTSGSVPSVANPIHFSSTPIRYGEGPPALGQHTRAVLQRVLGADDDMLRQWAAQGTIKEAP